MSILLAILRLEKENRREFKTTVGGKARPCQERKKKGKERKKIYKGSNYGNKNLPKKMHRKRMAYDNF